MTAGAVTRASTLPLLLPVIGGNALVAWLLATGRMQVIELLLLTVFECLALHVAVAIGERAAKGQGRRRRRKRRRGVLAGTVSIVASTLALAALLALLCAFQFMQMWIFGIDDAGFERLLAPLDLLVRSPLLWPLAITTAAAAWAIHAGRIADEERQIAARLLTLVLGAFPFIAPALLLGGIAMRSWQGSKDAAVTHHRRSLLMAGAAVVLMMATLPSLPALVALGVAGWMISFLSTKLLLEGMLALTPLEGRREKKTRGEGD